MCIATGITEKSLYCETFVNPSMIAAMMAGIPVSEATATKVLVGFNRLAHTRYTLNDFDLVTAEEQGTI